MSVVSMLIRCNEISAMVSLDLTGDLAFLRHPVLGAVLAPRAGSFEVRSFVVRNCRF